MKANKLFIPALLVALGLVGLGICIKLGIDGFKDKERVVSVKGLAEKTVAADLVIWPIVYKEIGNDLPTLYNQISRKNELITTFLKDNGIKENEIFLSAPIVIDKEADRYSGGNVITYRYNITSIITVNSSNVELVNKLLLKQMDLLKQGVAVTREAYQYNVEYRFMGLNEIKPAMIQEATENARNAAKKFAEDSGSELGKIKTARQGQFTITNRDDNTPYLKQIRVVTTVDYYLND